MARTQTQAPAPAVPAPPQIHDAATAQDVRERLADRRSALALLQGEHDALDEQRSALLLSRSLGETFDTKALLELSERWQQLKQEIADEELAIRGLEQLLAAWDNAETERELIRLRDALGVSAAAAPALEDAYLAAIDAYVAAAGALLEAVATHQGLELDFERLRRGRDVAGHGFRAPCRPFPLPESFTTMRPSARYQQWSDFRSDMLTYRIDWRYRNAPATEDPASLPWWQRLARTAEHRTFQVLRGRMQTNFGRNVLPDTGMELVEGRYVELPAQEGAWIERDSPGSLQPVEAA